MKGQSDHDFFFKITSKEACWIEKKHVELKMCIKMTLIIRPSKSEQNIRTKMFLRSTQNQRYFNFKFRHWFNVDKLMLFRRWNTVIFSALV